MSSFFYFLKESLTGFTRNLSTALGSIVTIFLSLLIIGIFLVGGSVVNNVVKSVEQEVNITVWISDSASSSDVQSLQSEIKSMSSVANVSYTDKEQALENFKASSSSDIAESLDDTKGTEFTTTLTVTDQTVKNVATELTNNVGYIQLKQITQNSAQLVRQAIVDLDARGAQSYVLDLRDNPGGYLTQAVDISSYFIKSGTIVRITTKSSDETTKNATGDVLTDKPLVVLVNGNTSSSAEVIAASLKDNERATIVGTTTLGKGSVQVTHELTFGGALRYTAAYYKSPLDHDIDGLGINPDISIGRSDDDDNQKSLAMETAQSMVRE